MTRAPCPWRPRGRLPVLRRLAVWLAPWAAVHAAELSKSVESEATKQASYQPTRESLSQHRVPEWYQDAKIGFFYHWGPQSVVGEKFVRAVEHCRAFKMPLVCFSASGGARMQEGLYSLMQMAKTSAALGRLAQAGLPFISVLTDPTTGGVSASLAMLGDVNIGEPRALIGFAGPRVIQQTVRETLPDGFQRSEFLLEHGALDMILDRRDHRERIANILRLMMQRPPQAA